jgi:TDG/mug DNA glycosylase family protein
LRGGLGIVFVGINPSLYSVEQGHYFARRANRFWPCFSRSHLSRGAREGLGVANLEPRHDGDLLEYGFGFTDAVKRATRRAGDLAPGELAAGAATLREKVERYRPRIACFHGITAYRQFHRALSSDDAEPRLGPQPRGFGPTRLYLVPNPSPANAHFTPADQTGWRRGSAPIAAVDIDVAVRQIAGPDRGLATADAEIDRDHDVAPLHMFRYRRLVIIRHRAAVFGDADAADGDGEAVAVGFLPGLAHGHDDAPPIGVTGGERGLDEG